MNDGNDVPRILHEASKSVNLEHAERKEDENLDKFVLQALPYLTVSPDLNEPRLMVLFFKT